jgi:hypothetical protein
MRAGRWADVVAIAVGHALLCVGARSLGLDHISDDDFARVTIAQAFAHAPKLDPSGTSWLPFPFWVTGGLMLVVGRSLAIVRALSISIASIAATAPYLALRYAGVARRTALAATVFAFLTPWAVWLGASTVPESFTASLTSAGVIGIAATLYGASAARWRAPTLFGLAITAACFSRYEAWPVAAVMALALAAQAVRAETATRRQHDFAIALLCASAPIAWMAWNAHAHDGPLHFFRRVSTFKRALGEGTTDPLSALLLYPRLLFTVRPEVTVPALLLLPTLREPSTRRRWGIPLIAVLAQVLFLAYGNARDGSAAHHPERALLSPLLLLALFVVDVGWQSIAVSIREGRQRTARAMVGCVAILWVASLVRDATDIPGRGPTEERDEQIARGLALRKTQATHLTVTPCGFEHFALLAAYGAPETADIKPRTGAEISAACPQIDVK